MSQYLNGIYRACETGFGEVIRVCDILRSWAKDHRRDQHPPPHRSRALRRSKSPVAPPVFISNSLLTPPPSPPQVALGPILIRKRKTSGSPSPMSRPKRQECADNKPTSSPWANESWEQRHSSDLNNKSQAARDTRIKRGKDKRGARQPVRQSCYWDPFKYERSPSPPNPVCAPRVRLFHHKCPTYPGEYHQDIFRFTPDTGRGMPEQEQPPLRTRIDETALQATDFTPLKPPETGPVPPVNNDTDPESAEENDEEGGGWDKEGNKDFRHLLRNQPESYNDEGFKVPIGGTLSPAAQLWNQNRRRELNEEAAHEQQTPSRPPRRSASVAKASSIPRSQPIGQREADDLGFEGLSLKAPSPGRTPKSKLSTEAKEESQRLAKVRHDAREAAKDPYPLVPLSKAWDDKVRHAVNNGAGRFQASMFMRCVPWYSNDLRPGSSWLDDAVINDYIAMVAKHGCENDAPETQKPGASLVRTVSALSSYFFTKISSRNPNYSSSNRIVDRAGIRGEKLLQCEKVFMPINRSSHWFLVVIEPKIPAGLTAAQHQRKVTLYNSMTGTGDEGVTDYILEWIKYELGALYKDEEWDIDPNGESPQQKGGVDCGVFTCTTARQIMLGKYQDINTRYKEPIIKDMRKRLVAELVNGALLNKDESES